MIEYIQDNSANLSIIMVSLAVIITNLSMIIRRRRP